MSAIPITPDTPIKQLRQQILEQRRTAAPLPARVGSMVRRHENARAKNWEVSDVVVTRDGRLATRQEAGAEVTVSRVTTQIFAAVTWDEAALVSRHLPANASRHGHGWAYTVTNEFGDTFDLFIYYDQYLRSYRVQLLAPAIEKLGDAHRTHLYGDGHLCLSPTNGGGQHMLNNAYGESVLWCNGIGAVARGHRWPWGE